MPWKTTVFGITLYFGENFKIKKKIQHVSSIVAELLDQDQDGCADDPKVLNELLKLRPPKDEPTSSKRLKNALFFPDTGLTDKFRDVLFAKNIHVGQMVSEFECEPTQPYGVPFYTGKSTDSTPEEMNHFVMGEGAAFAYPKVFGMKFGANSQLTKALDNAR